MKECLNCKYAKWHRSKNGRLHPSGEGECTYRYKPQPLPNAFFWLFNTAHPLGGQINRKKQYEKDCPYFQDERTI